MASNLRVDTILPSTGTNVAIGTASGSVTFLGDTDISTNGDVTIGGKLGIGGILTYEDVTNIDSVGIITARSGINLTGGVINSAGNINCTSGRFQRGSATVQDGDAIAGGININGTDMDASVIMSVFGNDGDFTRISGSKSRNASVGSHTIVQNNDVLLSLKGFGSDGTNFEEAAQIEMQVDGSPGNNVMPGRIVFKTATTDGVAERLRITSTGVIQTGSKTITGGNNLAIQNFAVKGVWSGSPSVGKSIELISGYDSAVKMAAVGYNLTDTNTGSTYGGDLTFHTQPLYSSPTTPLPVRMRISSSGYVTKPYTPFFSVYGTNNNQTYNDGSDISFENALHNVGNHFKMTSGTGQYQRFIAPVAGVYIFTFGFFPNTASNCRIQLNVNGNNQTNPYISGSFSNWGTGVPAPMGSQMLKLSASDYVTVRVTGGTLSNTYDGHTGFQGFLLG